MKQDNKKLYESIMASVAREVKKALNEGEMNNKTNGILTDYEIEMLNEWFNDNFDEVTFELTPRTSQAYNAYIYCDSNDENYANPFIAVKVTITRPNTYKGNFKIMIWDHYEPGTFPYEWPDIRRQETHSGELVNDTIEKIINRLEQLKPRIDKDIQSVKNRNARFNY